MTEYPINFFSLRRNNYSKKLFDVVENHGRVIYEAPTIIKEAYFFIDSVVILYHSDLHLNRKLGTSLTPLNRPDDKELYGRNILKIDSKGNIIWQVPLTRPLGPPLGQQYGFSDLRTEKDEKTGEFKWVASSHDGYIYEIDIETGQANILHIDK